MRVAPWGHTGPLPQTIRPFFCPSPRIYACLCSYALQSEPQGFVSALIFREIFQVFWVLFFLTGVDQRGRHELTQGVGLAVLVGDSEDTHYSVALLPQAAVHLLAEQALANYG